jgi:Na+/H+-dicarboxylate symporter
VRSARRPALPGIVIPSGLSINLDGSVVYLTRASLFLAQVMGIDLSRQQQLIMVGVTMLTSKGTAGSAGGPFIVFAGTITAVGHIPLAHAQRLLNDDHPAPKPKPATSCHASTRPARRRRPFFGN